MIRHLVRIVALLAAIPALPPASPLGAQLPVRTLAAPELASAEPFTIISGFRELRDGRVLVSDFAEKRIVALDLRSGAMTPVGRVGAGPGEWGVPSRLHAMPGDSTLMEDSSNDRMLIILPDGRPGPTFRIAEGSPASFASLIGVDARGRLVLTRQRPVAGDPTAGATGVVDVLRYDRATTRVDTIAQLAIPKGEFSGVRSLPGGLIQGFTNLPLAARDIAAISAAAPGARLAVVRAADYHVEWYAADGARVVGARAQPPNIRVTNAEKEAFVKAQVRPGGIITRTQDAGRLSGAASGGVSGGASGGGAIPIAPRAAMDPDMVWPAVKPPFLSGAAAVAPDGRLWVLRTRAHDDPVPEFDVFDATGKVVERVRIPARTRLLGFGRGTVYLARTDDDDLVTIERHRLR